MDTRKITTTKYETLMRSMERTFMSVNTTLSKIYREKQWEKCLIVLGSQKTPVIDMQLPLTILAEALGTC